MRCEIWMYAAAMVGFGIALGAVAWALAWLVQEI